MATSIKLNSNLCVLFAALLLCIISCKAPIDSKESYLKEYKEFVAEIKENKDNYSKAEWKEQDAEFKKYSEELYQKYNEELGMMEQLRIAKYAITYGSIRGVNALNKVLEDDEIEKSVDELKKLWDDDLKDDIESAITEVKKVWDDDLKDELESKLGELKKVLEDESFQKEITDKVEELKTIVEDEELQGNLKKVMKDVEKILKSIEEKVEKEVD